MRCSSLPVFKKRPALQSIVIQYFESSCALNVFMNARSKRSKRIKRETSTHHNVISIWSIMAFSLSICEHETIRRPLSYRSTLEPTTIYVDTNSNFPYAFLGMKQTIKQYLIFNNFLVVIFSAHSNHMPVFTLTQ